MNEEDSFEEEFLKIERERYCNTQCHAKTREDCPLMDIVFVTAHCRDGEKK